MYSWQPIPLFIGTYKSLFSSGEVVDNFPPPKLPKESNWARVTFLDLDEEEIARQLTIRDSHLYADIQVSFITHCLFWDILNALFIQPVELLKLAWSKDEHKHKAPNVLELIERFNQFSAAASSVIVQCKKLKLRVAMVTKLIEVCRVYLVHFRILLFAQNISTAVTL